jgi:hypothetical protein
MSENTYRVRKQFLVPLTLDLVLLFLLIAISFFMKAIPAEMVILVLVFVSLLYIFLESIFLETSIGDKGIRIKKFLREKTLSWNDITNVDTMMVKKKVYLLLTTTKGFHILSNTHGDFYTMVSDLSRHVDSERVEESVRTVMEEPVKRRSDILSSWLAAIILVVVICLKIGF